MKNHAARESILPLSTDFPPEITSLVAVFASGTRAAFCSVQHLLGSSSSFLSSSTVLLDRKRRCFEEGHFSYYFEPGVFWILAKVPSISGGNGGRFPCLISS